MRKLLILVAILAATPAWGGRGATFESIMGALASRNADVIASELERAERLVCARCVGPIMELLDDDDYRVREAAAWWFARRPVLAAAITMQSIPLLQGTDAVAAAHAADVVGTFRHPGVLPVLAAALKRSDFPGTTKAALVRAVGTIGDPAGLPAVVDTLADAAPEARAEAVRAYDALRGVHTGGELAPLLGDGDVSVRRVATAAIAQFKVTDARATLEGLLAADPDPIVRRNAAFALVKLGGSRDALSRASEGDPVMFVRSVAKAGLAGPR